MSGLYLTGSTQSTMSSSSLAYISSAVEYPRASNRLHASARLSASGSAIATTCVSASSVNPRACCVPCRPHPTIPTLYLASPCAISPPLLYAILSSFFPSVISVVNPLTPSPVAGESLPRTPIRGLG